MSYQHKYVDGTKIHFPVGKVVCIGRNYAEHAKELDNPVPTEPLLFIKPGSCVVALEGGFSHPCRPWLGALRSGNRGIDRQTAVEQAQP